MNRWQKLLQDRADLIAELSALRDTITSEGRPLTTDEQTRRQEIGARLAELDQAISFEAEAREAIRNAPGAAPDANTLAEQQAAQTPGVAKKVFETPGQFWMAVAKAEMGDFGARNQLLASAQGMGEAVDSDGGYLAMADVVMAVEKRMHDTGSLLRLLSPTEVSGNGLVMRSIDETSRAAGSRNGAVLGYWVDEGTAPSASSLKFSKIELKLKKVAAIGYATDELLADANALASVLEEAIAEELAFQVEDAIINGDGSGRPLGILNAGCVVSVSKETNQEAASILTTNLSKMWARLHSRSKPTSVWLINTDCNPQLDELTIPAGTGAVEPRFVNYGPDGILRIKGRPVVETEYNATLGTVGDIILADLSQYKLITKGGVQQASSMHVRFIQDEMTFRATYRVDGQPKWRTALTPFKGTGNTQSPFITLATRS